MKTLLMAALCFVSLAGAYADVAPRPPNTTKEVKDPQNYLTMRDETVDVVINGHRAHVTALFHFSADGVWRTDLEMRIGFPELTADAPLQNFSVRQRVYPHGGGEGQQWEPVSDFHAQGPGSGQPANLPARWKTWKVSIYGGHGAPKPNDVDVKVTYDQELSRVPGGWRYTYVLRSGAPWKGPIGAATVNVTVKSGHVVAATPNGATRKGSTLTWSMTNFKPTKDVSVEVR